MPIELLILSKKSTNIFNEEIRLNEIADDIIFCIVKSSSNKVSYVYLDYVDCFFAKFKKIEINDITHSEYGSFCI